MKYCLGCLVFIVSCNKRQNCWTDSAHSVQNSKISLKSKFHANVVLTVNPASINWDFSRNKLCIIEAYFSLHIFWRLLYEKERISPQDKSNITGGWKFCRSCPAITELQGKRAVSFQQENPRIPSLFTQPGPARPLSVKPVDIIYMVSFS